VASPTYLGGIWDKTDAALVDPGKLAVGLAGAARTAGVRIHERTPVTELADDGAVVRVHAPTGHVRARRVLLATSAYPPLLRAIRRYVAPVYDYALMTEPLSPTQRASIGWKRRQGIGDMANQFHYYRLTRDERILWGGYDAVYRYGGPVRAGLDDDEPTFAKLSQHFFTTFPQLEGVRFSHRWGGAIDTCSRFSVFFGTAHRGRVAYAVGYTGLGVVSTRFGARVALDLLDGRETEATRLRYVRSKPVPFPPEPLRSGVIQLTRNRLDAADRNAGRRGLWLRTLDRLGLGFDS
jgi:glycine/D-amino acid oxidase-like deaminating enzyme